MRVRGADSDDHRDQLPGLQQGDQPPPQLPGRLQRAHSPQLLPGAFDVWCFFFGKGEKLF